MFKDEFKKLRIISGYTQDDLAKKLKVSKSTVSMYESGSRVPGLEMLEQIADFFNVDMNKLTASQPVGKNSDALDGVYLSFAKNAQDSKIHPDDILLAIETIKRLRGDKN